MSIEEKISSAAAQNALLLKTLSDTDYAISAREQSTKYLTALELEIADEELKIRDLSRIVASEYEDYKKYRDSHMRRFASKLRGKNEEFQEKSEKEEKEWLAALQSELTAKKHLELLKSRLSEARHESTALSEVLSVRHATQTELDQLYSTIFEGPSPEIPGEDEKEAATRNAANNFNAEQLRLSTEKQTKRLLLECIQMIDGAMMDIRSALSANTMDCWGVADTYAEWGEANSLSSCNSRVAQAQMLYASAQKLQPLIRDLGPIQVAQMNLIGNFVFDNVFSDMNLRERLRGTEDELGRAGRILNNELHLTDERQKLMEGELNEAKIDLAHKRKDLQELRAAAFDRISGMGTLGDSLPAYSPPSYQS